MLGVVIGLFFWGDCKDCGRGASEVLGNHSPGGDMKFILAVLGLVVLVGCQDLGDYPDYKATTPPVTPGQEPNGRPADRWVPGQPTILTTREISAVTGVDYSAPIVLSISASCFHIQTSNNLPEGMSFDITRRISKIPNAFDVWIFGVPRQTGVFYIYLDLQNAPQSVSRCWFTLRVTEATRQSVAQ